MTPQTKSQLNLYKCIYELCGKRIDKLFVCNIYPSNAGIEIEEIAIDKDLVASLLSQERSLS